MALPHLVLALFAAVSLWDSLSARAAAISAPRQLQPFNYSRCPTSRELWAWNSSDPDRVPRDFKLDLFAPTKKGNQYYELAFHDWTQYPTCPKPSCLASLKQFDPATKLINDTFSLTCVGQHYHPALRFELTKTNGAFLGFWTGVGPQHGWIPDTVVDFKLSADKTRYEWVIEVQCVDKFNYVEFVGINFYAMDAQPGKAYTENLIQIARSHGLGTYLDTRTGTHIVDQKNCTY